MSPRGPIDDQQPGVAPPRERMLSDQLARQVIVVLIEFGHCGAIASLDASSRLAVRGMVEYRRDAPRDLADQNDTMAAADPIRLALVITELEPGGAERCLVEIATRLDRQRFSPVVYSLARGRRPSEELLASELAAAANSNALSRPARGRQTSFAACGGWRSCSASSGPRSCRHFCFMPMSIGARAAGQAGVPAWSPGCAWPIPAAGARRLERWTTRTAPRHVCVSQSVADFYQQRGFPSESWSSFPTALTSSAVARRPADRPDVARRTGRPARICLCRPARRSRRA